MKKIIFELDYGIKPIRTYDEEGNYIDAGVIPDDLPENKELEAILDEICNEHMKLFLDNSIEFSYQGFISKEHKKAFDNKIRKVICMLRDYTRDKYVIDVNYDFSDEI